jgi:hypothetical protein
LLRSAVSTLNIHCAVTIVFERTEELASYLDTPYIIDTPMQPSLVAVLLNDAIYHYNSMLWVTHDGRLMSNNATWKVPEQYKQIALVERSCELSLLYTLKTDGIVCMIDQQTRTATVIAQGAMSESLSIQHTYDLLATYLNMSVPVNPSGKVRYEKSAHVGDQQPPLS